MVFALLWVAHKHVLLPPSLFLRLPQSWILSVSTVPFGLVFESETEQMMIKKNLSGCRSSKSVNEVTYCIMLINIRWYIKCLKTLFSCDVGWTFLHLLMKKPLVNEKCTLAFGHDESAKKCLMWNWFCELSLERIFCLFKSILPLYSSLPAALKN